MYLVSVLGTVLTATAVSRFLRRSRVTAGLRTWLSVRSPLFATLFSCPHCIGFWTSLLCASLVAHSWLQGGVLLLLGWRGAYHANRLLDFIVRALQPDPRARRPCHVCGRIHSKDFIERQGLLFCSYGCWFGFLRKLRRQQRADVPLFDPAGIPARQDVYPGGYADMTVEQAHRALAEPDPSDPWIYIDVRTPEDFADGHPAGAYNLPLYLVEAGELVPNQDFLRVAVASFPPTARLLVGDGVGSLSRAAACMLVSAGYARITRVRGGYHTTRRLHGAVVARGWAQQAFAVEYRARPGREYAELSAKVAAKPLGGP